MANAMFNCNYTGGFCGLAAVSPKSGCVVLSTRGIGERYVGGSGSTLPKAMSTLRRSCTAARSRTTCAAARLQRQTGVAN